MVSSKLASRQINAIRLATSVLLAALQFLGPVVAAQSSSQERVTAQQQSMKFVAQAGRYLNAGQLPNEWESFSEFNKLRTLSAASRSGFLSAFLLRLEQAELATIKAVKQAELFTAVGLLARQTILTHVLTLIPTNTSAVADTVLINYLKEEIGDIQLFLESRITPEIYFQGRAYRDNKRIRLLGPDADIMQALLQAGANGTATSLANRSTLFAITKVCVAHAGACARLAE